jgi:4-alpha-glucanotransferase
MALIGTHDTPTLAGWLAANDIAERISYRLLAVEAVPDVRKERETATGRLARRLRRRVEEPRALLAELLDWLGNSKSPLVVPWLEDLWLEEIRVNLPGTRSSERPNWQRPNAKLLDEIFTDPEIDALIRRLHRARSRP